ncbi:MAG: alkaline phosphatase family protein [Cyclobacteriaceae bacterium]
MKKLFLVLILLCGGVFSCEVNLKIERPKLVVGIVVDQMRQEYLFRFYEKFGSNGFKRLMDKGFMMKNAHFNYIPTKTGPGHTSVYTGTTPRVHGVIGNDWYEKVNGGKMYCAGDSTAVAVGGSPSKGKISSRNMLTTTITDELGLFFQNRSKIVSMSLKDRGAALPAGHNPTGAFWYDSNTGNFMSSSYYVDELPAWLNEFNSKDLPTQYMSGIWETSYPIEEYTESSADDRGNERKYKSKDRPTFPYDLKEMVGDGKPSASLASTPYGNTILKDLAIAALQGEEMGQDEDTDFLAISFSSTDHIGHAFGPYSKEIEDTYVKLDEDLEELFKYLDETVGPYQYNVFLTADHAVADIPAHLSEQNYPVDYFPNGDFEKALNEVLTDEFGESNFISSISNEQIYLNKMAIKAASADIEKVKTTTLEVLNSTYGIASAYDAEYINNYSGSNYELKLLAAGYNAQRSGDILYIMNPGWLGEGNKNDGTTHGSHYTYDTHVPMLFYGAKITTGSSVQYHPITDIAPTLSMLLNIKLPSGATGQPIEELFGPY